MATKKQVTKEQVVKSAKALLELAKDRGYLDDLCAEGNKVVGELSELVGINILEEKTVRIILTGTVSTNYYDDCDEHANYKVEVTYKGKKVTNLEIDEACLW